MTTLKHNVADLLFTLAVFREIQHSSTNGHKTDDDEIRGRFNKLQFVIEKTRMEIMTYKQHLFFNIIAIQI